MAVQLKFKANFFIRTIYICQILISSFMLVPLNAGAQYIMVDTKYDPGDAKWVARKTLLIDSLRGYTQKSDTGYCQYGGLLGTSFKKTGFFRVEKIDNRWWCIDPDGHLFIYKGVVNVAPVTSPGFSAAYNAIFDSSSSKWADSTSNLLSSLQFNGTGCWSDVNLLRATSKRLVYCPYIQTMFRFINAQGIMSYEDMQNGVPLMSLHPKWATYVDSLLKLKVATYKDDPYCFGYFTDNELHWEFDALDKMLAFDNTRQAEHDSAWQFLRNRKGSTASASSISDSDRDAFLQHMASAYWGAIKRALNKYDPNHLLFGMRFHSHVKANAYLSVVKGAGDYVDVIAHNWYLVWTPEVDPVWEENPFMEKCYAANPKPYMVTEWYSRGYDTAPYLTNENGAGWLCRNQQDRAYFYDNFTISLLKDPNCVGWHWFQYADNDPLGSADGSNTNSNKGILNNKYQLYKPLTGRMQNLNKQVFSLLAFLRKRSTPVGIPSAISNPREVNATTQANRLLCRLTPGAKQIVFDFPQSGQLTFNIYTVNGKHITGQPAVFVKAGIHSIPITSKALQSSGVYIVSGCLGMEHFVAKIQK
jgi:hypothetical protein